MSTISLTPSAREISSLSQAITTRVLAQQLQRQREAHDLTGRTKSQFMSGTSVPTSSALKSVRQCSIDKIHECEASSIASSPNVMFRNSAASKNESAKIAKNNEKGAKSTNEAFNRYKTSFSKTEKSESIQEKARNRDLSSTSQSLAERYPRLVSHPSMIPRSEPRKSTVDNIRQAIDTATSKDKVLVNADQFENRVSFKRSKDFFDKVLETYHGWIDTKNKVDVVAATPKSTSKTKSAEKKTVETQTSTPLIDVYKELAPDFADLFV